MDFKEHIINAWKLTLNNIVPLILMTLVFLGISAITLGIMAPVTAAGYTQSILLLVREHQEQHRRLSASTLDTRQEKWCQDWIPSCGSRFHLAKTADEELIRSAAAILRWLLRCHSFLCLSPR